MDLYKEQCRQIQRGEPALTSAQAEELAVQTPEWTLGERALAREYRFADFREAMAFVNRLADLAEAQNHHPDIIISYNTVKLHLSTHKIGGLSRNDFILAAKIDDMETPRH